jgi:hypothetical protein
MRLAVSDRKPQTTRFPALFVHGQDALSQRQVIEHSKHLGWSVRPADDGAMIAAKEGREVLMPASRPRYSAEQSASLVQSLSPFAMPSRGKPDSAEFDSLMHMYRNIGLPLVGVGRRWGPTMPQIRESAKDAPPLREIDEDMQAVAEQRWAWAQRWYPTSVTAQNRDDVRQRSARWSPETKRGGKATKWRPCTHVAMCMWASSAHHLSCRSSDQVGELIGAKDPRTVRKAIEIGDRTWASLGAWPWSAFAPAAVPADWWALDEPWELLGSEVSRRITRAQRFLEAIGPSH